MADPNMDNMETISKEAQDLHRESIVIDLHADTPTLMGRGYDLFKRHRPLLPRSAWVWHVDVPRMEEGGLDAQLFAVCAPVLRRGRRMASVLAHIELIHEAARQRPERFRVVTGADGIEHAAADGITAAVISLEGAHALRGNMANLDRLAEAGLRSLGMVHFTANEACVPVKGWGSSATKGLTDFGRQLVAACNEKGILVDLAHMNRPGFMETCALSSAPVVVTHTGLGGVYPLWRNIDDEQVRAVADTGGCIGIGFGGFFLGEGTIGRLVDHIEHCIKVGGEDCPALGSDFDGYIVPVHELPDVAALPRLTAALLDRGLDARVVRKVLGGNALRVMRGG